MAGWAVEVVAVAIAAEIDWDRMYVCGQLKRNSNMRTELDMIIFDSWRNNLGGTSFQKIAESFLMIYGRGKYV